MEAQRVERRAALRRCVVQGLREFSNIIDADVCEHAIEERAYSFPLEKLKN